MLIYVDVFHVEPGLGAVTICRKQLTDWPAPTFVNLSERHRTTLFSYSSSP